MSATARTLREMRELDPYTVTRYAGLSFQVATRGPYGCTRRTNAKDA
jgi:hypothetical protein